MHIVCLLYASSAINFTTLQLYVEYVLQCSRGEISDEGTYLHKKKVNGSKRGNVLAGRRKHN